GFWIIGGNRPRQQPACKRSAFRPQYRRGDWWVQMMGRVWVEHSVSHKGRHLDVNGIAPERSNVVHEGQHPLAAGDSDIQLLAARMMVDQLFEIICREHSETLKIFLAQSLGPFLLALDVGP